MSMFYLKSEMSTSIYAPCDGEVVSDENLKVHFSAAEIGFSVLPCSTVLYAPINGVLSHISNDLTTYIIKSTNGAKILLKIGDRRLLGDGLHTLANVGQRVTHKDRICSFDPEVFEENQIQPIVTVRLLNPDRFRAITIFEGECRTSFTEIMNFAIETQGYRLRKI